MVTEMWDDWDLRADRHRQTFDHPELYDFVDVSQNNHNSDQKHWDNLLFVRHYLSSQPRPMNTTKIYGADGNKFNHTDQDAIERFWRHLLGGAASVRFHRPDSGLGLNDKAVACIRAARTVESQIPLWTVAPANERLADRHPDEAYLAAAPGSAYIVYFPAAGRVTLDLTDAAGTFAVHWIDIDTGAPVDSGTISGGTRVPLTPPGQGNQVAAITRVP